MVVFAVARARFGFVSPFFRFSASGDFYSGVQSPLACKMFYHIFRVDHPISTSSAKTSDALQFLSQKVNFNDIFTLIRIVENFKREKKGIPNIPHPQKYFY